MNELTILDQRADKIRALVTTIKISFIEIGRELIAAQKEVPDGQWTTWLENEFAWSPSQARKFMQVAEFIATSQEHAHARVISGPQFSLEDLSLAQKVWLHLISKRVPESVRDEALRRAAEGEKITKAKIDEMMAKAREEGRKAGKDEAGADARAEAEKAKAAAQEAILKAREKAVADFQSKLDDLANQLSSKQKEIDKLKVQGSATAAQRKQLEEQLELVEKAKRRAERDMRKAERELEELKARGGHIEVFAMKYQQDVIGLYTNLVNLEPLTKAIMENQDQLPPDRIKAITDYFNKISKLAADYASNMRTETGKVITIDSRRK